MSHHGKTLPAPPSTCLSGEPHGHRVSDPTVHYFGCLRVSKRDRFFNTLPLESKQRILRRIDRIDDLRHRLETAQCDTTAAARLRDFKHAMSNWFAAVDRPHASFTPGTAFESSSRRPSGMTAYFGSEDLVNDYIKAPVVYFKDGRPFDVPGLSNSFPSQKVIMSDLLSEDETRNPLMQSVEEGTVRYFHLPANNMAWVEEAMARYYHERPPDSEDLFLKSKSRRPRTKTEMLLRPEYWQGQQNYEADSEVHARHMRPLCSGISTNLVSSESNANNLALFMPYLHWETDRGRINLTRIVKEVGKQSLNTVAEVADQVQHHMADPQAARDTSEQAPPVTQPSGSEEEEKDEKPEKKRRKAIANILRTAAALLEAMDLHTEEQLMCKYLHAKTPLHPRRTLDQSYYGALKSTGTRDRDQVVYRGTTPAPHVCTTGCSECDEADDIDDVKLHKCTSKKKGCPLCNEDARKVPRIIMVDQLWLWILDEQTVITSFPRTWGKHKPDPSAIHKSLRMRFKYAREGEVSSAYDLALMIVDECSRVFFDRTKTNDRQPNLVELFNGAIRDLTYKQTAAFDQFLIYTHLASRDYKRQRSLSDDNSTQNTLLNINPEGYLLKEVKDIIDEIHIMMRIKEQQQSVMESFVKHIRRRLVPIARQKKATASQPSTSWDVVLGAMMQDAGSPYSDETFGAREEQEREEARRTLSRADHLLSDLEERIAELRTQLQNAQNTSAALKDLLTLKQQQAGVIEAREAVKQAQLTLKQGQSIMIFTIVTIIFLPLSFCVGFFGMNAIELNDGLVPLQSIYKYLFPVSTGIILVAFLFAFSQAVFNNSVVALGRSAVSFAYNTTLTWLLVKTNLYVVGREMNTLANRLRDREATVTGTMKAEVLRNEKNIKRMHAADHVRGLTRRQTTQPRPNENDGIASGRTTPFSPYSVGAPGSPFAPPQGNKGLGVSMTELDLEMGEGVSVRRPSSQRYLVPTAGSRHSPGQI
ncbi:hypothetical protein B0H63DRAFT_464311 [Podospora didyma]|uniref:Ankyrin repeat protein n=1 Tax=Podospora didyma TaxID=330526 RepID=A0AAE0NXY5_9PEZI|nr:hypothetical protein B0H63DRAFT_464311 [Podospora didyma]